VSRIENYHAMYIVKDLKKCGRGLFNLIPIEINKGLRHDHL